MKNPTVFFHKYPGIDSFVLPKAENLQFHTRNLGDGVHHLWAEDKSDTSRWPGNEASFEARTAHLEGRPDALETRITWNIRGLQVQAGGKTLLAPVEGKGLRICGSAWALTQVYDPTQRFYGQGEKSGPLERTGRSVKFWNTDVAGEFATSQLEAADTDPMYVTVPWLITYSQGLWVGVLLDNPYMSFMYTNKDPRFFVPQERNNHLILGSTEGNPAFYVFVAPDAKSLVRKFQLLVGVHPRPPLWALGHHQSRWGYDHAQHLEEVAKGMDTHDIPNSGLWLDIGYMDQYRVFTWNPETMPDPKAELDRLKETYGSKIVPIIDPGVKLDPGYPVYDTGKKAGHYCKTPEGSDFVGYVWPGETVFPDFSQPQVRDWWADYCKTFMETGIDGAWIDMNDPSTGWADSGLMLFDEGKRPHSWYHSRYAKGMAQATFAGFTQAQPDKRAFVLSRSAYTGQAPWSAVWLGDNLSNWNHLRTMIPMCLNLSLSGIPFNGPDAPGFDREPTPHLAREWYKAQFLFPFLRNHSCFYAPRQEPWTFGKPTLDVIRRYIRLRYRLLPYLYQTFVNHSTQGDPILRPLWYQEPSLIDPAANAQGLDASRISDQFFTGSDMLQAPFVDEHATQRQVLLPAGWWYSLSDGIWMEGGRTVTVKRSLDGSPAFVRDGAVIPCQPEGADLDQPDPWKVEFHVFSRLTTGLAGGTVLDFEHTFDDGETLAYQKGSETKLKGRISLGDWGRTGAISLERSGSGQEIQAAFVFYRKIRKLEIQTPRGTTDLRQEKSSTTWTSRTAHKIWRSTAQTL